MLDTNKIIDLKYVNNYLTKSISECSNLQNSNCEKRLKEIYSKLILYYIYQKDITQKLINDKNLTLNSYEWQSAIKYEFDTKSIISRNNNGLFHWFSHFEFNFYNFSFF